MNEQPCYGRIVAVMLSVITTALAVAYIAYCLMKNLIAFCAVYVEDGPAPGLAFDEIEESCDSDGEDLPSNN